MKVTVMGLGLHGGGLAAARFFAERGAEVTITDLRDEETLKPSIEKLDPYSVRYVLGRHEKTDFIRSDLVIKNPAVPKNSPFLQAAPRVETDMSVFLSLNPRPVIGITGSKGKSTTSSAAAYVLTGRYPRTRLGGNITVSPLTFFDDPDFINPPDPETPVVLELSSWQLADLEGKKVLHPRIAAITVILPDHMNHYDSMNDYVYDKSLLLRSMKADDDVVLNYDDAYTPYFTHSTAGKKHYFTVGNPPQSGWSAAPGRDGCGGTIASDGRGWFHHPNDTKELIIPKTIRLSGIHNRTNLLCAGMICRLYGLESDLIRRRIAEFSGIPHRLELVETINRISFYNDSAATIPEATVAAVNSIENPIILITGGTDKKLDFDVFRRIIAVPKRIILLRGSATEKIKQVLDDEGRNDAEEYPSLEEAFTEAVNTARPGDAVLFSPGCASFELFLNEFDRGDQFKKLVGSLS